MERFFDFAQNHPILVGTFIALAILFFLLESKRSGKKIAPQQVGILSNQGAAIIDLREPKEYREGHISGSRNIPFSQLKTHVDELKALQKPIVMVCKMGTTAGSAVQLLENATAYRLDGGIMNWKAQGLPLIQSTDSKTQKNSKKKKRG